MEILKAFGGKIGKGVLGKYVGKPHDDSWRSEKYGSFSEVSSIPHTYRKKNADPHVHPILCPITTKKPSDTFHWILVTVNDGIQNFHGLWFISPTQLDSYSSLIYQLGSIVIPNLCPKQTQPGGPGKHAELPLPRQWRDPTPPQPKVPCVRPKAGIEEDTSKISISFMSTI